MSKDVSVSFPNIILQLDKVAKERASGKAPDVIIDNLMINDDANALIYTKNNEYQIVMKAKDEENVPQKSVFLDAVREYTTYFVGGDEAQYVKGEMLLPILDARGGDEGDETSQNSREISEKQEQKGTETETTQASESYAQFMNRGFLNLLFEDETNEKTEDNVATEPMVGAEGNEETQDDSGDIGTSDKTIGYSVKYKFDISDDNKNGAVSNSFGGRKRGWFDDVWSDLKSIKVTVYGKPVNIGKIFDKEQWKQLVGKHDINVETAPDNIRNIFDKRYPNSDVHVKVWERGELNTFLNRRGKNTPQYKSEIDKSEYSVSIMVDSRDPNYPKYGQKMIAQICTDAFGTAENKGVDWNKVDPKEVIKIENCDDNDKYTSSYDQKTTGGDAKKKSKSLKEAEGDSAESGDNNADDEKNVQDTLKTVVEKLKEQVDKEFSGMDVAAPEVSKTEDYVKSDEFKNLNDSKLAFDLEREGKVVYHFAVKRRVNGGKLNESEQEMVFNVICRLLLEELGLDETDAEHGSVDTPEPTAEQMKLGDANITGNKDDDAKVRKVVDAQVEKMKLLKKTQKELKPKCLKVFQNAIYDTIKERSLDVGSVSLNMRIGTYFTGDEKTNEEEQIREVVRSVIEGSSTLAPGVQSQHTGDIPNEIIAYNTEIRNNLIQAAREGTGDEMWQASPYAAVTTSRRVVDYMTAHQIGGKDQHDAILAKKYAAIVIAKRDLDGTEFRGTQGNRFFTTDVVEGVFDRTFGNHDDAVSVLQCNPTNRKGRPGELFEVSLGYNRDRSRNKRVETLIDAWVKPFDIGENEVNQPEEIPVGDSYTMTFVLILPDPFTMENDADKTGDAKQDGSEQERNPGDRKDLYIVPNKKLKRMSDNPNKEIRRSDGTVVATANDSAYKS